RAGRSVAFTPDGPRGPRRELKPGVIAAAQRGNAIVIPVHAESDRVWRLHSWDRFMIPRPFARVRVTYGVPFEVEQGDDGFAEGVTRASSSLAQLSRTDAWRAEAIAIA
ncbi:MAG: hypothetical protein ACJ8AV_02140, partial [Gemmatimonadales bacterium]